MDNSVQHDENNGRNVSIIEQEHRLRRYKIVKTIFMANIWLCLGFYVSVVTPCVDALKDGVHTNYEKLSRAFASKSIGKIVGSLLGGYIADKYQRWIDVQLGLALLFGGIAYGTIPWAPNTVIMGMAFFVNGLAAGTICAGGNSHIITLWGKEASGPFHFIHSGFGVGRIIGPLVVAPFIPNYNHSHSHNGTKYHYFVNEYPTVSSQNFMMDDSLFVTNKNTEIFTNGYLGNSTIETVDVRVPFAIAGGNACLIAIVFFVFSLFPFYSYQYQNYTSNSYATESANSEAINEYSNYHHGNVQNVDSSSSNDITTPNLHESLENINPNENHKKSIKEIFSLGACANGNSIYALQMFSMIFVFYVVMVGRNCCVVGYSQPVSVHTPTLNFTLHEADLLITVFFACFTGGRIYVSILSKYLPIQVVIFGEAFAILTSAICLVVFALDTKINFWLTLCAYAFCNGPIYPSGMAWSNQYLKMTGAAFALLDVGIGCGAFTFNWLCGYILTKYPGQPIILYYLTLGTAIATLVLLIFMQIRGSMHGNIHNNQLPQIRNVENEEHTIEDDTSTLIR